MKFLSKMSNKKLIVFISVSLGLRILLFLISGFFGNGVGLLTIGFFIAGFILTITSKPGYGVSLTFVSIGSAVSFINLFLTLLILSMDEITFTVTLIIGMFDILISAVFFFFCLAYLNKNKKQWQCPKCGLKNRVTEKYCGRCGMKRRVRAAAPKPVPAAPAPAPVPAPDDGAWFCTNCGSKNKNGAIFCTKCGKKNDD